MAVKTRQFAGHMFRGGFAGIDAEFAKQRKERRAALLPTKRLRRVSLGPYCTFYFESFETMLFQIQEMLLIEKGGAAQLADELAVVGGRDRWRPRRARRPLRRGEAAVVRFVPGAPIAHLDPLGSAHRGDVGDELDHLPPTYRCQTRVRVHSHPGLPGTEWLQHLSASKGPGRTTSSGTTARGARPGSAHGSALAARAARSAHRAQ